MSIPTEIKVKIKSEDVKLTEDFHTYEPFTVSSDDPYLQKICRDTLSKFSGDLIDPEISLTIKCVI